MDDREQLIKTIAENIRKYRLDRGINQATLAELCECTQSMISQLESGGKLVNAYSMYRISQALDVTLNDLYYPNNSIEDSL